MLGSRARLTTTHPHGHVIVRPDRRLGLVRISKNASTESMVRLECRDWLQFAAFDGPTVAFLREPYGRFLSSIPETMLRVTHPVIEEPGRKDRVVVPEDVFRELCAIAGLPMKQFVDAFLELVEYAFFDAHHEPQVSFLADRRGALRIDPHLYSTASFEQALQQIDRRFRVRAVGAPRQGNVGGAKPLASRHPAIDLVRRVSRTRVYRRVSNGGPLMSRYCDNEGLAPTTIRQLNAWCNAFTAELKAEPLGPALRDRVEALYADGLGLWKRMEDAGGDIPASVIW